MSKLKTIQDVLKRGTAMFTTNKGLAIGGIAGIVGSFSLIRGLRLKKTDERTRNDQMAMMKKNPALWMYERRKGNHLYGQALIDRDMELFGG